MQETLNITNEDDIVEHALNFGLTSASTKYGIPRNIAASLVQDFMKDVSKPCQCEQSRNAGINMMCFLCSGPQLSHTLQSFNWNS